MGLITRCPACGTAFRVLSAQLAARGGKVRCGKCAAVFDGVAALVEESEAPLEVERSPQLALFESGPPSSEPVEFLTQEEPPPPPHRLAWGLAAGAAAAGLALQAALHYRTEAAVLFPESRGALAAACAVLDCQLHLPRRPELLAIESSDLQSDASREGVIVLNAAIRNRAPFPQDFPSLELTLTDERDRALVRRVLRPAEYLGAPPARLAQGIAAGAEASLRVHLDTADVRAVGYRLYLFYPS